MIEVSKVYRSVKGKGHDRALATKVAGGDDVYLVAVADGLTSENGGEAAQWAVDALERIAEEHRREGLSARSIFGRLSNLLRAAVAEESFPNSHTTLTCGVVSPVYRGSIPTLRFDFFAIGDSPVWKVLSSQSKELEFQGFVVYSGPFPGEQGRVYSTLSLHSGSIDGVVYFGSVDVEVGEVLVLASDGFPDSRFFWDDQDPKRNKTSPKLALRLLDPEPLRDETLARLVAEYDAEGLLVDDDASLVVVRTAPEPPLTENGSISASEVKALFSPMTIAAEPMTEGPEETNLGQPIAQTNYAPTNPPEPAIRAGSPLTWEKLELAGETAAEPLEFAAPTNREMDSKPNSEGALSRGPDSASEPAALVSVRVPVQQVDSEEVPLVKPAENIEKPATE